MSMEEVRAFFQANHDKRFALTGHQRPDGDSIGSALGLAAILRGAGYQASSVNIYPVPERLHFLYPNGKPPEVPTPGWTKDFDCLIALDCGEWSRLDVVNQEARGKLAVINLDHHASSQGIGDVNWIESTASSVGEMVVRLSRAAGWDMPPEAAQSLWVSLVTDTGRFSYENTNVAALEAAGICLANGAEPNKVARKIYQSITRNERSLQAHALASTQFYEDGRLGITWLDHQDFVDAGCGPECAQDMINLVRDTAGVEVALFLSELPAGTPGASDGVKASIRTIEPHDAIKLVAQFGGGGHHRAAGCTIHLPMEAARQTYLEAARRTFFA